MATRRLIEVDFPIGKVSDLSVADRHIRAGHVRSLHIWWARKPLPASRAVILASLLPDPEHPDCPAQFLREAPKILAKARPTKSANTRSLREQLLRFVADSSAFDAGTSGQDVVAIRKLLEAAGVESSTILDPFVGGGSHALEALRVGGDTYASDLNPVAALITRVVAEFGPRHGTKLVKAVRDSSERIMKRAEGLLRDLYKSGNKNERIAAYLWARTATCEGPHCGLEFPLTGTTLLSKKKGSWAGIQWNTRGDRVTPKFVTGTGKPKCADFTYARGAGTCPACGMVLPKSAVKRQGRAGELGHELLAVLSSPAGKKTGQVFRAPTKADQEAARRAEKRLAELKAKLGGGSLSPVPDEPFPIHDTRAFTPGLYGVRTWGDLYSTRQLVTLLTLVDLIRSETAAIKDEELAKATRACLGLVLGKVLDNCSMLCSFGTDYRAHTFVRAAIPVVFYYTEFHPLDSAQASFKKKAGDFLSVLQHLASSRLKEGRVAKEDAGELSLPDASVDLVFTDPPYFDAIPYADLTDYFYVWLRRCVGQDFPELFAEQLTPKDPELLVNKLAEAGGRAPKDAAAFTKKMDEVLKEMRRVVTPEGLLVLVFAHKSTEGWEAVLEGIISAGWTVVAAWPVDTEMASRLRAIQSAALASSIYLVCRPRQEVGSGDWREVLALLRPRITEWLPRLAREGIVGADAIFACLGPALEIYSRYAAVETAGGVRVGLADQLNDRGEVIQRGYLSHVWEVVAEVALLTMFEEADARGLEPDGRLAALFLWTLNVAPTTAASAADTKGKKGKPKAFQLPFDTARKIAQGLGIHLEELDKSVVEIKGDTVRLTPVRDRQGTLLRKPGERGRRKQLLLVPDAPVVAVALPSPGRTTLDRVHQAMLLFASGNTRTLNDFLQQAGVGRSPAFWRLAQALSALYPPVAEEKRWLDGVLAKKRGLR